jgi:hypothetical protein
MIMSDPISTRWLHTTLWQRNESIAAILLNSAAGCTIQIGRVARDFLQRQRGADKGLRTFAQPRLSVGLGIARDRFTLDQNQP